MRFHALRARVRRGTPRASWRFLGRVATVVLLVSPGLSAAAADQSVSDADRALLTRVRQAGLWETPAGRMAAEKGRSQRVREIGEMIAGQHVQLDELVVEAARDLGVDLPDEPTADQKRWLAEMEDAEGAAFDQVFVDRLRAAHGVVFPIIGDRRAYTSNEIVRELATQANGFVINHMEMLESTGLARYDSYNATPAAGDPATPAQAGEVGGDASTSLLWVFLATALVGGGVVGARFIRARWVGEMPQEAPERRPADLVRRGL